MSRWKCGTEGCDDRSEDAESAVIHQAVGHERHECKVCGTVVPEGYPATHHTLNEHTCAEFVHAYDADSSAVRTHEDTKDAVEADVDLNNIVETPREQGAL